MRIENRLSLERLSTICDICGLFSVLIGFVIIVLDLLEHNYFHIQIGIYVFVSGYGMVKTSHRIVQVLLSERREEQEMVREQKNGN